jgi:hypothetical protein
LIRSIVLDPDGQVLDGRNRLASCRLVGVTPTFVSILRRRSPHPPISENVSRHHMPKGALAMAVVKARAENRLRDDPRPTGRALAALVGLAPDTISRAQVVYTNAPDLIPQVIAGGSLLEACEITACAGRLFFSVQGTRVRSINPSIAPVGSADAGCRRRARSTAARARDVLSEGRATR